MKSLRLVFFLVFILCAFCLPSSAQTGETGKPKQWTYEGRDSGGSFIINITKRPNGYEVSGEYFDDRPGSEMCTISGSYYPAGQRIRAKCIRKGQEEGFSISGSKDTGKDELKLNIGGNEVVATRVGAKSTNTGGSTTKQNLCPSGFGGTWKTSFGAMTITFTNSSEVKGNYDFDDGTIKGDVSGDGRVLTGTYTENEAKGTFRFNLDSDGRSFNGDWHRTSGTRNPPSGTWSGKCLSAQ